LLARGIRPHFVCALDHHEISRRFYEGLTAEDVEGVTLVVEPKASAAILEAFPGRVRVIAEPLLEKAAGPLAPDHAAIKPGSTVSHLCHYFARALRADPVIHTGLDLGFTDGQYYSAGAAIHDVWAPELNEFRSLEMFEWERIARGKATLHSKTDHLDRRIYTDDQMNSYLARFESDFAEDEAAGRTVIDATEGGVKKRHTSVLTLADALELYDPGSPLELPETPPGVADADGRAAAMREQLDRVAAQAVDVRTICNRTVEKLRQMLEHFEDRDRVDSLITGVHELRDEVETLQPAYGLIQFVNQTGTLNRFRRDRAIALEPEGSDELETQRQRIERDIENVEWLADAAGTVSSLVRRAAGVLGGSGPRETRDRLERAPTPGRDDSTVPGIAAVVFVDPDIGGLGLRRDLGDEIALGQNALRLTLRRLRLARRPGRIVLATGDPGRVRELAGDALDADPRIEIAEIDRQTLRDRLRAVGSARQWSLDSWRGALGNLAAADEGCDLRLLEQLTGRLGLDAALLVSPDAVLLDPALIDEVVTRYAEAVDAHRLAFVPAPAGLGAVLLRRTTIESLAAGDRAVNPFASIGALLSYIPVNPQADPLGKGFCVQIPTAVRDIGRRLLADTRAGRELAARLIGRLGDRYDDLDAAQLAALCDQAPPDRLAGPVHLVIEPCTGRLSCGLWSSRLREALNPGHLDRGPIDAALVGSIARQAVGLRAETTITFHGAGDPLMHPHAAELVDAVKLEGVGAAHLRTDLLRPGIQIEDLVDGGADVVSVDALAIDPLSFVTMHGHDRYDEIESTLEALAAAANRTGFGGLPCPWIVPRITRSDESFEQIEGFFDAWIMAAGAAMIDPLPGTVEHARIAPLPTNRVGRRRTEETTLFIDASGVAHHAGEELGSLRTEPLAAIWRRALRGAGPEIVTRGRPVAGVA
ncbi:MAG: 6-hydroxymethylpterin diphosphokinase MptE-like protein, partial [Planctomycetota bacterium]